MRPRKQAIRESFEELDELRRYYKGTIEEVKVTFLRLLKEEPGRALAETTRRVGISERRGRYWWETYCQSGLHGLLERRVWRRNELEKNVPRVAFSSQHSGSNSPSASKDAFSHLIDYPAFVNAVAGISELDNALEWSHAFRTILVEHIPEVQYALVNVRVNANINRNAEASGMLVVRQYRDRSGTVRESIGSEVETGSYETIIVRGQEQGFPFENYHFPPAGFDFFMRKGSRGQQSTNENEPNIYVGSILLFRSRSLEPFSPSTLDLIERLRPFITFVFTSFITRVHRESPGMDIYRESIARIAGEANLSNREQTILNLLLIGYSEKKIADLLNISMKTVESHMYSLYRKTGVTKVNELFGRYQTPIRHTRN